ncbi:hypothetical protein HZR00_05775 [Elizabethkingia anophelis]|nr:hypothetical protein [Elizabethkingia anophelis]
MELVFNEISFLPDVNDEYILTEHFIAMLSLYDKVREDFGFNHLVFPANISSSIVLNGKTFIEWVSSIPHQGNKNKILSIPFIRPFLREVVKDKESELPKYYYSNENADIVEKDCLGLATAYLMGKISISLNTHECWDNSSIEIKEIYNDDLDTKDIAVNNITTEAHLSVKDVNEQLMYSGKLDLQECPIADENKSISLRDDHGKDKLLAFSKKILKSNYVVSVINSLPFNPTDINLIRETYSDGKIELVLHWEDKGIGIVIQTTGRNKRETEEIAKLLKKKFDK